MQDLEFSVVVLWCRELCKQPHGTLPPTQNATMSEGGHIQPMRIYIHRYTSIYIYVFYQKGECRRPPFVGHAQMSFLVTTSHSDLLRRHPTTGGGSKHPGPRFCSLGVKA